MLGRLKRLLTGEAEVVFDDDDDLMKVIRSHQALLTV
jgi:hypothetical protein